MFCPNCGKQLHDGVKFCSGCGHALSPVGEELSAPTAATGAQPTYAPPQQQPYQQPNFPPQPQQYQQQAYAPQNGYYYAQQPAVATKKKPAWVWAVLVLALLAVLYYVYMDRDPEQAARAHVFAQYGDAAIETALAGGIPDSTWTWSSTRNSLNDYTVTANGKIGSNRASLEFTVTYSGRTPTVRLSAVNTAMGDRLTDRDELDDILEEIYSDYNYYRR